MCISSFSNCTVGAKAPLTTADDLIIGYIGRTDGKDAAAGLHLRKLETAATTLAQLAAGMTSAASINAGISDSSSSSISYSFNGEIEVA